MAIHDKYGKQILLLTAGESFTSDQPEVDVFYGSGLPARIDGTISGKIAVEIESRVSKQVRGAILDLICHVHPKKLLVLMPVHMSNPNVTKNQCDFILSRFLAKEDFEVVLLEGSGSNPQLDADVRIVKQALKRLGYQAPKELIA